MHVLDNKKHKANTGGISGELDKSTIVGDLNFPLLIADKTNRQKSVKTEELIT